MVDEDWNADLCRERQATNHSIRSRYGRDPTGIPKRLFFELELRGRSGEVKATSRQTGDVPIDKGARNKAWRSNLAKSSATTKCSACLEPAEWATSTRSATSFPNA